MMMMRTTRAARPLLRAALPVPTTGLLMAAVVLACVLPAAQAVHRCETDGKISYSDRPCPGARPLVVDSTAPVAAGATALDANQQRQSAELARLQQLRELRERQDQRIRDLAARGAAAKEKKCRTLALQMRWREEDLRDATLTQEMNARKRLRRTEERYREECR